MERHKCKLCTRRFSSGRALGGHMRFHLTNLRIPPKPIRQLSDRTTESTSSSSSSSGEEENVEEEGPQEIEEEEKGLAYVLRENPKKSIKLADPEFSFIVDAGSVVIQDRESETESRRNPTRRRSKRNRRLGHGQNQEKISIVEKNPKLKKPKPSLADSTQAEWAEPVLSSVSDTSPEEEVAICLMMLSRDIWVRKEQQKQLKNQQNQAAAKDETVVDESKFGLEKYKCETCSKVFSTYQAFGGHRASHKKIRGNNFLPDDDQSGESTRNGGKNAFVVGVGVAKVKVHECPFCHKVFGSGQALGGHKRSHLLSSSSTATKTAVNCAKVEGESLIDLNFPPMEDEEGISQLDQVSAVSDAEFINPIIKKLS